MRPFLMMALVACMTVAQSALAAEPVRVGSFDIDASPPVGSPLAYDPTEGVQTPLSCRGIVLTGAEEPMVVCAIDWIGISNGGLTVFREALGAAAGTRPEQVVVHALHQHDAPRCDFSVEEIIEPLGLNGQLTDPVFNRDVIRRACDALKVALAEATPVTHLGLGSAIVEKIASNRRILGPDGKVKQTRWTATRDPELRALPVGRIDPELKLICLLNGDRPIVAMTYYATHPQSYYRTGMANPDFPGLARNARQEETGIPHIHFTGAAGNIGAGKWNDGSKENRQILANRLSAAMKRAWDAMERAPLAVDEIGWSVEPVSLPLAAHVDDTALMKTLHDEKAKPSDRWFAAKNLIWARRCRNGDTIDIACLRLGEARVLHMPGELFVEYQLAAQECRPDLFVAMAAYGDYTPGYIGTELAYSQGGYETSPGASKVAPQVEAVLMRAVRKLLDAK